MSKYLLPLLLLAGCGVGSLRAPVGGRAHFPLMTRLETPGQAAVQHFRIENRGRVLEFNGLAEIEETRLSIVGLSPLNSRAFSVTLENNTLNFEHLPFYSLPMKPATLMAAYQMMFQPEGTLRQHLEANGLSLNASEKLRRVYRGELEVVRIEYETEDVLKGKAMLRLLRRNQTLSVDTKQVDPIDEDW